MTAQRYNTAVVPALGSRVLVRFNFCDEEGNIVETQQFQGEITTITEEEVIIKHPSSGKEVSLPPHFGSYERPPKGDYELPSTGELITDPDYITEWTLRASSSAPR